MAPRRSAPTQSASRRILVFALVLLATFLYFGAHIAFAQTSGNGVEPILIDDHTSTLTCGELISLGYVDTDQDWDELKIDPPVNGSKTDGMLEVTISNLTGTKSFDFTSTIGVDAVLVKAGSAGHYLYVYDPPGPESHGDTGLTTPGAGTTNQISHITFCYDPNLEILKDAHPSFDRTWDWDIAKSVDPLEQDAWAGQTVTADYTVEVTKTGPIDSGWAVEGTITVLNPLPFDVTVDAISDEMTGGITASVSCPVTLPYMMAAGESFECTYQASLPDGSNRLNTVTVETEGSYDAWTTAEVDFGLADIDETKASVNVTDTQPDTGGPWQTDQSTSWTYDSDYTCPTDTGDYTNNTRTVTRTNTAAITGTPEEATAETDVTCWVPPIDKTAETAYTLTYDWDVDKTVDPAEHHLFAGQEGTSTYELTWTRLDPVPSDWMVSGLITVLNPAPIPMPVESIEDAYAAYGPATITGCWIDAPSNPVWPPVEVPAGSALICAYADDVPDGSATTNTATVTLEYGDPYGVIVPVDFTSTAPEDITEIDATAWLADTNDPAGLPSTASANGSLEYQESWTCGGDAGRKENVLTAKNASGEPFDSQEAEVDVFCYEPVPDKTVEPSIVRIYDWSVTKTVDVDAWALFTGDTGTSEYALTWTKSGPRDAGWGVEGVISVPNPAPVPMGVMSVTDQLSGGLPMADVGPCWIDSPENTVETPVTVPAESTLYCAYAQTAVPNADPRTNTARVMLDTPTFPTYEVDKAVEFGQATIVTKNDEVGFQDQFDDEYVIQLYETVSASGSTTYTRTYACDEHEGEYNNTFRLILEVPDSNPDDDHASASVSVACYGLDVVKTVEPAFDRSFVWDINKAGTFGYDPDGGSPSAPGAPDHPILLAPGQAFVEMVAYSVSIEATPVDLERVSGDITITNPHPDRTAIITDVEDVISGEDLVSPDHDVSVDCGTDFPFEIDAGDYHVCTYAAALPDQATRTNTATAQLRNHDFTGAGETATGTTPFSDQKPIDFTGVAPSALIDECIDVVDSQLAAPLANDLCAAVDSAPDVEFSYEFDFVPPDYSGSVPIGDNFHEVDCGDHEFPNTASFLANDTGQHGSASWTVAVEVDCGYGCTLTQGYWKTHSEYGKAPYDDNWAGLPQGADTPFYLSGQSWYEVFWTPPKGDAYFNLAHQYMAARLNAMNGASVPPEVADAFAQVEGTDPDEPDGLLEQIAPGDLLAKGKAKKALRDDIARMRDLASTFASYNEGDLGPGHCDEDFTSEPKELDARMVESVKAALVGDGTQQAETDVPAVETPAAKIELPKEFGIGNYPNPFNPTTNIRVALPVDSHALVEVFDVLGRRVATLVDERLTAGNHDITFDASELPSGAYMVRLDYDSGRINRTMHLVK